MSSLFLLVCPSVLYVHSVPQILLKVNPFSTNFLFFEKNFATTLQQSRKRLQIECAGEGDPGAGLELFDFPHYAIKEARVCGLQDGQKLVHYRPNIVSVSAIDGL